MQSAADTPSMAEVRRKYEGTDKWLKAPNGNQTNLSERQWLQVRTPEFKQWFGDWEKAADYEWLMSSEPVTNLTGEELSTGMVEGANSFFVAKYGGKVYRDGIGTIMLTRRGINSSIAHGVGRLKAAAFIAVPDVIAKGRVFGSTENYKGRGYASIVIDAPIRIGGKEYVCEVVVNKKGPSGVFYLHEVEVKEKLSIGNQVRAYNGQGQMRNANGKASRLIVSKLAAEGNFNSSKVLDENGEPLALYHGTGERFDVFDRSLIGESTSNDGIWGKGFYFTPDSDLAQAYAEGTDGPDSHVEQVFLRMVQPYRMEQEVLERPYTEAELADASKARDVAQDDSESPYSLLSYSMQDAQLVDMYRKISKGERFDGVVYRGEEDFRGFNRDEYVVPSPNQIKSATDNSGGFDADNSSILFQSQQSEQFRKEYQEVELSTVGTDKWMKAPNGEDTNLNEEQWITIRTPSFKQWFGDWENDPTNASKILDENGEPLVVYHGSMESFDTFMHGDVGFHLGTEEQAKNRILDKIKEEDLWSDDEEWEDDDADDLGYVIPAFVNLRSPLRIFTDYGNWHANMETITDLYSVRRAISKEQFDSLRTYLEGRGMSFDWQEKADAMLREALVANGYDGIVYNNMFEGRRDQSWSNQSYIAFSPNQIKSATDNNGDFSSKNDSILFQGDFWDEFGHRGNGYNWERGMSNNAVAACEDGEKPLSRWTKKDILEGIEDAYDDEDVKAAAKKLALSDLKGIFLTYSSWHHTGKYFNRTDFYSIDDNVTVKDINEYLKVKNEGKGAVALRERRIALLKQTGGRISEGVWTDAGGTTHRDSGIVSGQFFRPDHAAETLKAELDNVVSEAPAWLKDFVSSETRDFEESMSGKVYHYGRKPDRWSYIDPSFFKAGEQRLSVSGNTITLQEYDGTEWHDVDSFTMKSWTNPRQLLPYMLGGKLYPGIVESREVALDGIPAYTKEEADWLSWHGKTMGKGSTLFQTAERLVDNDPMRVVFGKIDAETIKKDIGIRETDSVPMIGKRLAAYTRKVLGKSKLDLGDLSSPRVRKVYEEVFYREVCDRIANLPEGESAVGWYKKKIEEAYDHYADIFPELKESEDARIAIALSMAITSQGETVMRNGSDLAPKAYRYFKEHGQFPTTRDVLNTMKWPAMAANFAKINRYISEDGLSLEQIDRLLAKKMSVGEMRKIGINVSGAVASDVYYLSAIMGPKIGGGFYSNIRGRQTEPTLDMWMKRAFNRIYGQAYDFSDMSNISDKEGDEMWSSEERAFMFQLLKDLADRYTAEHGLPLDASDVQAVMWYNEKDLYGAVSPADRVELGDDYASAAATFAVRERLREDAEFNALSPQKQKERLGDEVQRYLEDHARSLDGDRLPVPSSEQGGGPDAGIRLQGDHGQDDSSKGGYPGGQAYPGTVRRLDRGRPFSTAYGEILSRRRRNRYGYAGWDALVPEGIRRSQDGGQLRGGGSQLKNPARSKSTGITYDAVWTPTNEYRGDVFNHSIGRVFFPTSRILRMEPALENARLFKEYFNTAKKTQGNDQWRLSAYKAKDYLGMDTFIAEDGSFGFALKEGDIVSVFADAGKAKGATYSIIPAAIDNGGTHLDCFDGALPKLYSRFGFKVAQSGAQGLRGLRRGCEKAERRLRRNHDVPRPGGRGCCHEGNR